MKWWDQMSWCSFFGTLSFKLAFSLFSFTFIQRPFNFSSLSVIRVVSSAYLMLLIFLPGFLIPACTSSSAAFHMMYSVYKLNKQGDNLQLWRTPFPIWSLSVVLWASLIVGKESACNAGDPQFNSWVGKILWRRERLPTPVFWPGEFHGECPWVANSWTQLSNFHSLHCCSMSGSTYCFLTCSRFLRRQESCLVFPNL